MGFTIGNSNQAKKQQAELQSQIDALKSQVADAEKKVKEVNDSSSDQSKSITPIIEKEYSIQIPSGWQKDDSSHSPQRATYSYVNKSTGDYFDTIIDPGGGDVGGDMYWKYDLGLDKKSFIINKQGAQCTTGVCQKGDGKLVVLISSLEQDVKVMGHTYLFVAGNTKIETADTNIYKTIIETIKVK